jgi:hypothetical protein
MPGRLTGVFRIGYSYTWVGGSGTVSSLFSIRRITIRSMFIFFEDHKRLLKFDVENWSVMDGKLTAKARKAL